MLVQDVRPWTLFAARAATVREISPHLVRVTFVSADPIDDSLREFARGGADTRVKLLLPAVTGGLDALALHGDWYSAWRLLPDEQRPAMRTYTVRAVRPATADRGAEVDIDLVLHGVVGPASAWATALLTEAQGDSPAVDRTVLLCGPNAAHGGPYGGREWRTPSPAHDLLLVGDETALPAIAAILEDLPADATGAALIEVPSALDALDLTAPQGMSLHWLARDEQPDTAAGALMTQSALDWLPAAAEPDARVEDLVGFQDELWDVPPDDTGPVGHNASGIRAWIAGEASAVRKIRRHLVGAGGLPRREVAFMGYWRRGRSEGS